VTGVPARAGRTRTHLGPTSHTATPAQRPVFLRWGERGSGNREGTWGGLEGCTEQYQRPRCV